MKKDMTPEERRAWEADTVRRNNIRSADYDMLKELIWKRRVTMTERRRMQELESALSDIVEHYVLTDEEREEVRALLDRPETVPVDVCLTEEILESVFRIRDFQDKGHHGHQKVSGDTRREWVANVVARLGEACPERLQLHEFKAALLEVAATAVAAAEWVQKEEARREAERKGLVSTYDEARP